MAIPSVEESMMTSPTGAGERRGLPRNLHWLIIGVLGLSLSVVILSTAFKKEESNIAQKTQQQETARKSASSVERPVDTNGITAIQKEQEATVPPAIEKLPPVPGSTSDRKGTVTRVMEGDEQKENERILREQQRQETISGSAILAIKGKSVKSEEIAQRAAEAAGTNPAASLNKAKDAAIASILDRSNNIRAGAAGAMGVASGGNPFSAGTGVGATGAQATQTVKNQQWIQGQQTKPGNDQVIRVEYPASSNVVMQGTTIPVVLVTALNSDMPGQIVAMASSDVYDSIQGRSLIIPRGSKLYGQYNSDVQIGQERALAAFQRLIRPDGSYVNLMGMPATEANGQAGVPGDVNNHFFKMFGASFMVAGLAQLFDNSKKQTVVVSGGTGSSSLSGAAGEILVDVSKKITQRNSNLQPTITVPSGERFNVTVTRDIDIPPYRHRVPGQ